MTDRIPTSPLADLMLAARDIAHQLECQATNLRLERKMRELGGSSQDVKGDADPIQDAKRLIESIEQTIRLAAKHKHPAALETRELLSTIMGGLEASVSMAEKLRGSPGWEEPVQRGPNWEDVLEQELEEARALVADRLRLVAGKLGVAAARRLIGTKEAAQNEAEERAIRRAIKAGELTNYSRNKNKMLDPEEVAQWRLRRRGEA